jgi:hypothetical protein
MGWWLVEAMVGVVRVSIDDKKSLSTISVWLVEATGVWYESNALLSR